MHLVKCSMCGYEFEPANAQSACNGCPLVPDCHLMRCPRCGYEMPPEAKLIGLLRKLRERAQIRASQARGSQTNDRSTTKETLR